MERIYGEIDLNDMIVGGHSYNRGGGKLNTRVSISPINNPTETLCIYLKNDSRATTASQTRVLERIAKI